MDPEQRQIVSLNPMYDTGPHFENESDDDDDDEFVVAILSVCSDEPESFRARPTNLSHGGGLVIRVGVKA
ncbi:hypothetical protein K503DRAFT_774389 [Rhizopogon vinicolor AM-OR11-026]|uniref:Uncharacterized protein n=1 Tax=Rhizopogon vinicolor AM-OR11-026 TaxID=1314800 RepID=A0A1B7MPU1_9AGAM|nr:hypothetical protein K503DRAFT_774389 [Rhizopogon vinicolor AM-OR11-026]